jgi:hypothetical protein
MKKKALKIIIIFILAAIGALVYLNFIYLPRLVAARGPGYLQQKSNGRIKAASIRYAPFKGVELKDISIVSGKEEPLFSFDKAYLSFKPLPLFIQRKFAFRAELYPLRGKQPLILNGLYRFKQRILDLDSKIKTGIFIPRKTIRLSARARINKREKSTIDLTIAARDLNVAGNLYIQDKDLFIEKFSGNIFNSDFDLIGDVQNLKQPFLNIYGNLNLDLADLKHLSPEYARAVSKLKMAGRLQGKLYISSAAANPQVGLKMAAGQIMVEKVKIDDLSLEVKVQDKLARLNKFYARLYGGEVNLQASTRLDTKELSTVLDANVFNLDVNHIIGDLTGKGSPLHGRLFTLGRASGSLKQPRQCEVQAWVSISGANILQFPLFTGITEVLNMPTLRNLRFKEAGGNFTIARQEIRTDDFTIAGNSLKMHFKGYMDFNGNLAFDIQPEFSDNFLAGRPEIGNILGIFIGPTGNFMGEMKLKGTVRQPRYTFKPLSGEGLIQRGIEEGLKQLFKLKKKE